MWFLIMIVLGALILAAYRQRKAILRYPEANFHLVQCILGNEAAVIFFAALALLTIVVMLLTMGPSGRRLRELSTRQEATARRVMATCLGQRLRAADTAATKVLVIDAPVAEAGKTYHEAVMAGLRDGFGGSVEFAEEYLPAPAATAGEAGADPTAAAAAAMVFRAETLDELTSKHPEHRIIVSLIGVPADYEISATCQDVQDEKRLIGIYTTNPYPLGRPIALKTITGCVIPKRLFTLHDQPVTTRDVAAAFDKRYLYADASTITQLAKSYRSMFMMVRKVD